MVDTPGSGGWSRPRGSSMTSSEASTSGEIDSGQGGLEPTGISSTSSPGTNEDHSCSPSPPDAGDMSSGDVGYGCQPNREHLAPDPGPRLHLQSSDLSPIAAVEGGSFTEEFKHPSPEPPVTKATLSELDIPRIVYNPKLRHDVNFDPNLHFRPNLDGESGRRKAKKANDFWNSFQLQMEEFMADPAAFESRLAGAEWGLHSTLQAISEILGTLVPPEDRAAVQEILDIELLMQQFRKGVADFEMLGSWLARTLKSHCAPMRDEWVDETVAQLVLGDRNGDVVSLVEGMQSLLGVLEAMKLDVANHQIRCLRPLLIQDTVEFEQTFFMKKIGLQKIDIVGAHAWFQAARLLPSRPQNDMSQDDMWIFFKGFAHLLLPSKTDAGVPDTFMFDEERIDKLRSDISDAVNLDVCVRLLENIYSRGCTEEAETTTIISAPPKSLLRLDSPISTPAIPSSSAKSTDLPLVPKFPKELRVNPFPKTTRRFHRPTLDESFRRIELESDEDESGTESPPSTRRTSFSSMNSTSLSRSMELPVTKINSKVSQAILAIVNDAPGNTKWQQRCSDIALELLRPAPNYDDLSRLESQLTQHLCNPTSAMFQKSESYVLAELYPLLSDLAARYTPLTATQLFEVATSPRPLPSQAQVPRHALSDVAKQMAHIGTLHWRVWAELAYLVNPEDAGHVTDATDPESRSAEKAWGRMSERSRRPAPERQNSMSESIPTGS